MNTQTNAARHPMRLMIVGSEQVDAIENYYLKYLRQLGVDVLSFPAHMLFDQYYYHSLFNKLAFKFGFSRIYDRLNRQFREIATQYAPRVIWVFKGMEIFPETLAWAKERGIILVNYNPDNPFLFTGKGSGNSNIARSINLFDLHFTYNLEIRKRLEEEYHARTAILPFGFDIDPAVYRECISQDEVLRVCFLGNPDKQRVAFINELAAQGITLDLYGNHWNEWLQQPHVRCFDPVYGLDMWKVLRRYRVQLNLMRIHNQDSHNMRTFEVPAIGGIMLAPDTTEHRIYFTDKEEIFLYRDAADCAERCRYLLDLPRPDADRIRENARRRSLTSGYSYEARAKQFLEQIQSFYA
ncbi:MAG: glycosyltransferase [Bacteroidota bacterium]|nr:glycosyltransferase [Bacteroidota bacterium]MDP4215098.1 glycosyltransferase [Bacteroidota bacterium]MDP4258031.1 glycosyltransferase [Bacteroidota bacterium]